MPEEIQKRLIEEEMKESYVDYAMSVIVGRALPDVKDGLKPVHRRVLYTMQQLGLLHNKPFKKSANIVGTTMAHLHPHGDAAIYDTLVRMAQDFSLRYPLVDGQGNWGCFTKDTKIALADGRNLDFEELIKEDKEGKKNYTFTIDKKGKIKIAEIKNPRLTKINQKILKIVLDNNEEINCTYDHKFMLRDGTYKEAIKLKAGDSLMPLYIRLSDNKDGFKPALKGYPVIYQPKIKNWVPCHNLADSWNLDNNMYKKNAGKVRHHIDFNKFNNNPNNVRRIKWGDHWKLHAEHASNLHKNENYRKKISEGRIKYWSNPDNRKINSVRLSQRNKRNWANPKYREKMCKFLSEINKKYMNEHPEKKEEFSKRATKTLKKLWKNPAYREMRSNSLKEKWKNPDYYKEQAERMKQLSIKIWSNPKHRKYISAISKELWKDKEYKNKILSILSENGKKANYYKFIIVCKKTFALYNQLNEENYEKVRISENYRKGSGVINFNVGLKKFFNGDIQNLYRELGITPLLNHKVKEIIFLGKNEDVYDITIEGTHNFALVAGIFVHNSVDGDAAASMRYTEARLSKISEELLIDIEKDTVDWIPNYDNSTKEPVVLPAKLPNLLINGSSGIAVGMATNIPPHNINEVVDAIVAAIDNPNIDMQELIEKIPAPDFPTGAFIVGKSGIHSAYMTGRGKILLRAKTHVEEKKDRKSIIVTEIPYQVNKSMLIEAMADLVKDKKIEGISDIRDESDRKGMRIVIELKKGTDDVILLNQLFKNTQLQTTFGVIMLALVDGQPKILNLKEIISCYIKHRKEVVTRRTQFELRKAENKAHILEGLKIALSKIDDVIKTIKASKDPVVAKAELIKRFSLSEIQSQAILDMRLHRLTSLEQDKIKKDYEETLELIKKLRDILASEQKILGIIKDELFDISNNFSDARKTQILDIEEEIELEELIQKEDVVVTVTHSGYIKQLPVGTYKQQRRGGKGIIGTDLKEEDVVEQIFTTHNHNYILFFSNKGQVYWLKAYQIPQASRYSKGKAIVNLLNLKEEEKITALVPIPTFEGEHYLLMATKKGILKKTLLSEYSRPRKGGIIGITLKPGDELVKVRLTPGILNMVIATKNGLAVKFSEKDVNPVGRQAMGVKGIRLSKGDEVIGMEVGLESGTLLTVTENGFGKRTPISDYRLIRRGGKGVINIKTSDRNGRVIAIRTVTDSDEIILMSQKGVVIRVLASDISSIGRNTQGVRIMKLDDGDRVKTVDRVIISEKNGNNMKPKDNSVNDNDASS